MKFNFEKPVEVPVDFLFRDVSDFDAAVVAAQNRGIYVQRTDKLSAPGPGMSWNVEMKIRKRPRQFKAKLIEFDDLEKYIMEISTAIFTTNVEVDCVPLTKRKSKLLTTFELKPLNLRGRLLIQSLKLARGRIVKRTTTGLENYVRGVEERYADATV